MCQGTEPREQRPWLHYKHGLSLGCLAADQISSREIKFSEEKILGSFVPISCSQTVQSYTSPSFVFKIRSSLGQT